MVSYSDKITHLSRDPQLKKIISTVGPVRIKKNPDLYLALMRAIVGQQLSVKAAATIWARFLELFPQQYPSPGIVLKMKDEKLRAAGLSFQKAGYLKNIAEFSLTNTLDYKKLRRMSDDELVDYLVQIKGVGRWTVEMILMFNLNRLDIFPKDDLGIQQSIATNYQRKFRDKKHMYAEMDRIAEQWRPYRTLACMYLWKSKDMKVAAK